jgi:lipopolysaccharide export system protein LptA
MKKLSFAALLSLALFATSSTGQVFKGYDSNAPVDFNAEHAEYQGKLNQALLTGNVVIKQGGVTITTQRAMVTTTQTSGGGLQADRVDGTGGVTVVNGETFLHSDVAIFDVHRRLITMVNDVTLRQGQDNIHGNRLMYDLTTRHAVMDGGVVRDDGNGPIKQRGGRVTGHFTVPQRTTNQ